MLFKLNDKKKNKVDSTVCDYYGSAVKKGDVGIEIEVEGRNLIRSTNTPKPWIYERDGSLRGEDNGEYVLSAPIPFDQVDEKVDALFKAFSENNTVLADSNRTSVHVHVNVGNFYFNRLTSLMALWYMSEDWLTHWCGEYRVGNLFCLRAKDSPAIIDGIRRYLGSGGKDNVFHDGYKYTALNPVAIKKYNSLEFRTLRGVREPEPIKQWVKIIRKLYDASERFKDPRGICEDFSMMGPEEFARSIFEELFDSLYNESPLPSSQLNDSLYEGIRFAQDLCYVRDWSDFNPVAFRKDPFLRKNKAVAVALEGNDVEGVVGQARFVDLPDIGAFDRWVDDIRREGIQDRWIQRAAR